MIKSKIFISVMVVLFTLSCGKNDNPSSLSGTQWGTTIQQVEVLLSFSSNTNGVLRLINPSEGMDEIVAFTYTYTNPNVVLHPTNPDYAAEYPNGIRASVHGNVMDFSEFFPGYGDIALTKK